MHSASARRRSVPRGDPRVPARRAAGAARRRHRRLEVQPRVHQEARRARLADARLAEGVRRRGRRRHMQQFIFNEEMAYRGAPRHGPRRRPRRADDHPPRHGGAEAAAPAGDRSRRRRLVPGLQRAGRRLRPRVAADARGRGRRRLRHQRPEDLDLLAHNARLDVPARAHRPGRAEAPRHQLLPARHEDAGHRASGR